MSVPDERRSDAARRRAAWRGEEDPTSYFRKRVADDWIGRLPPKDVQILTEACGPLMAAKRFVFEPVAA
ncbi:MAG: hypothetical protein JWQ46_380 [Phenylobacterium sp.]|nr:hypothetical protein [Phenylobacterium sp.]